MQLKKKNSLKTIKILNIYDKMILTSGSGYNEIIFFDKFRHYAAQEISVSEYKTLLNLVNIKKKSKNKEKAAECCILQLFQLLSI